jgi:Rrf2 family protein
MKLSRASTNALNALEYMAARGEDAAVASHHIAKARHISEGFLLKVLKPLVPAGVLRSVKGPHGGYRLARPASKITLLEVVEAVDGPIRGQAPLSQEGVASRSGIDHELQKICDQAAAALRKQLGKVRLSDLTGKK